MRRRTVVLSRTAVPMPRWAASPVVSALLAEAPEFAIGDPELERRVFAEAEADPVPPRYEEARRALV